MISKKIVHGCLSLAVISVLLGGCGYTTGSLLPPELDNIHVENFLNGIDPTKEVSDKRSNYSYQPGLEADMTRTVINEFIFDGNLAIASREKAAITLKGTLVDLKQISLRYDSDENVEEYRIEISANLEAFNNRAGKLMWKENNFVGQSEYTITGPNSKSYSAALQEAVKDLAERIVERTVEAW